MKISFHYIFPVLKKLNEELTELMRWHFLLTWSPMPPPYIFMQT